MNKNTYFDFHAIQSVPPSCINRDDTGSPKTAMYGGGMRARVSSQAWKRAMRQMFKDYLDSNLLGYRTKNIKMLVVEKINCMDEGMQEEAEQLAVKILELAGIKAGDDKKDVLFFISSKQVEALAELALQYKEEMTMRTDEEDGDSAGNEKTAKKKDKKKENPLDSKYKKKLEEALKENPSVDILLFGRMAASNPVLNYDAAAQVAHSISTHTITNEYDYFTAVDDCTPEDTAGAGHLGTVEFNSATLYRYATVNVGELSNNLNQEELKQALHAFAEAFIRSMPTGKQNTFANRTLPDMVYVTLREDQPVNLAGAFEKPIVAGNDGYVNKSENALIQYANEVYSNYVDAPKKAWIIGKEMNQFAQKVNIKELLAAIETEIE